MSKMGVVRCECRVCRGQSMTRCWLVKATYDEPVVIHGCPDNIVVNIDENASNAPSVSWTEPVLNNSWSSCPTMIFQGSGTNGGNFSFGKTDLAYHANDAAGNTDVCVFSVTVQSGLCKPNQCKNEGTCEYGRCTCPIGKGGATCEDDLSYVRCDSTSMTVVLDKRLLPDGSDASDVHFRSQAEDCLATDSDPSHIEMATGYEKCGTTTEEDDDNIIFQNYITFAKPGAGDNGAIITREYQQQIKVECCLNKVSVLTGNFQPQIGKIDINDKELGKFSLKISRFTADDFETEEIVDDGGMVADGRVMLGTKLYFGVVLDSTPVVGVFIKFCWASEEGHDEPQQDLIKGQ
ncbi:uncharacterized protein LOC100890353 [Strongylocentrotus purpuratus]|uniref:HYR domain-containing protein n=1 Tax=Strongylocentrotus purpuratus TaxID=7668 RepID=A0A7M7T172_STRPU|nr:uncharacterized protein LOC100890353 [Strongylocentrotus purpuratus]